MGVEAIPTTSKIIEIEGILLITVQKALAIIQFPVQESIALTTSESKNEKGEKEKAKKKGHRPSWLSKWADQKIFFVAKIF